MQERYLIVLLLSIVSIYDLATTIYGTYSVLGFNIGSAVAAIVLGIVIGLALLNSKRILGLDAAKDPKVLILKLLWFAALGYDIWTSAMGNNIFILQSDVSLFDLYFSESNLDFQRILLLSGLTIFVTASPIVLSYLRESGDFLGR